MSDTLNKSQNLNVSTERVKPFTMTWQQHRRWQESRKSIIYEWISEHYDKYNRYGVPERVLRAETNYLYERLYEPRT